MTDERKLEIFEALIDYLGNASEDECVGILKSLGVSQEEAKELEFFDFITDRLEKKEVA